MEAQNISPASAANFKMIDVGEKVETHRRAVASGFFYAKNETIQRIKNRTLPKGDVLTLCEVAGIYGAKKTSDILPLCHPLNLTSVLVWTECQENRICVKCEVKTVGKTGVEMEALSGVTSALLCLYDLTKNIDPELSIGSIFLELKEGGKTGVWKNPNMLGSTQESPQFQIEKLNTLFEIKSAIITLSDSVYQGIADDLSGPAISNWICDRGGEVAETVILPDEEIELSNSLIKMIESRKFDFIVTTGGTGLSPRDVTPETVFKLSVKFKGREVPGIGELLRQSGSQYTSASWLSRSVAYLFDQTLVVTLPGSPKAVIEGLNSIEKLICHAKKMSYGKGHKHRGER